VHTVLVGIAITAVVYAAFLGVLIVIGRRTEAKQLALLLPNLILLFKDLASDPRVPRGSKVLLLVGVVWFASPIDLIPEFIPVLGPLDDVVVAALILRHLVRSAGADVVAEHWRGERGTLDRILRLGNQRSLDVPASTNPGAVDPPTAERDAS
jgi:uncharacterized membrane protein YkvA (DUF1232 family)